MEDLSGQHQIGPIIWLEVFPRGDPLESVHCLWIDRFHQYSFDISLKLLRQYPSRGQSYKNLLENYYEKNLAPRSAQPIAKTPVPQPKSATMQSSKLPMSSAMCCKMAAENMEIKNNIRNTCNFWQRRILLQLQLRLSQSLQFL